jgi:predicted O-methyltransferase YrrM
MKSTKKSLDLTEKICNTINGQTFHHHYYILLDIANTFDGEINYLEIGCYAGGSASLMVSRENTNVISIDLGMPISPEIAINNVNTLNTKNNKYTYIQGNSQIEETRDKVLEIMNGVDILFIDGDHLYNGVINDFNLYSPLVKTGGYIIFDDYNDIEFSPDVKTAVNKLIEGLDSYEIIGCLDNEFGARPSSLKEGNCFIIKKHGNSNSNTNL